MDHRWIFIFISILFYVNKIQCDDAKHRPIDFLKPSSDEKFQREELSTTTQANVEQEPHGVKKFIVDVKNKFSHFHPVRDAGEILFGSGGDKTSSTTTTTLQPSSSTESVKKEKSNIDKIMDSMPSESEDMIRVVTLKKDEHYGKGRAKPKLLTKELQDMKSTEYKESTTAADKTIIPTPKPIK